MMSPIYGHMPWLQVPWPWKKCTRDAMKPLDVSEGGGLVRCRCLTWQIWNGRDPLGISHMKGIIFSACTHEIGDHRAMKRSLDMNQIFQIVPHEHLRK